MDKNSASKSGVYEVTKVKHSSASGFNPLVDAASSLFSWVGSLKYVTSDLTLEQIHFKLVEEVREFTEVIKNINPNSDYVMVCRYIICATIDDILFSNESSSWNEYSLLHAFNQDSKQDKFFIILERAIKTPSLYIDLMELIYFCLSLGYKGEYRDNPLNAFQLEQITSNLYKHIQAYRGSFNKALSPVLHKTTKKMLKQTDSFKKSSFGFICLVTACVNMGIFVSFGYLTDVFSNEVFKNLSIFQNELPYSIAT